MATKEEEISVEGEDAKDEISGSVSLIVKTNFGPIRRNRQNGLKNVECKICMKTMRNDHLKRHMKQHPDLMLMDEDEAYQEIRSRKQLHKEREKQQLMLDSIAHEMDAPRKCIEQDAELQGLKSLPTIDYDKVN